MIWHIFKKDWKLEWRLAVGVALVQLILSAILWHEGPGMVVTLLGLAALLARGFLIVETVHNDPIPGVRQDWLVRPIRRGELLAVKFLFTVLVVQGPVFLGDLLEALAEGFSFGSSVEAAFSRSLYMLLTFSFPILAISSLTRNLLEVLASGVFTAVVVALAQVASLGPGLGAQRLIATGVGWTLETGCLLMLTALTAVVLAMQFRRRMTVASRWLAVTGGVILMGILMIPWQAAAFALQSRISPSPGSGGNVVVAFEANPPWNIHGYVDGGRPGRTSLSIPVSVAGLPDESILASDHYEMHLIDSRGVVRAQSQSLEYAGFMVKRQGKDPATSLFSGSPGIYATVSLNTEDYLRLRDQKLRVEIDYSLTLMQVADSYAIPALNGEERLPGVGWCRTHVNQLGDSVVLSCLQAGRPPDCYAHFLEHIPSGRRDEVSYGCVRRDYSPYFAQFFPDSVARFGESIPFRGRYAVGAPDIAQAQVVIRNYRTLDHFTRTVTTPEMPLSYWLAG